MKPVLPALWAAGRRHWPAILTTILLGLTLALILSLSIRRSEGRLIYALDDAYIHMAIAKNFVQSGTWGVSRFEFSSSSSSLLWPLLLTLVYGIAGVNELAPLLLNVLFATATIWVSAIVLRTYGLSNWYAFVVLVAIVFLTPLPALILAGMEHVLQILVSLAFACVGAGLLSKSTMAWRAPASLVLLALAPIVTLVRYEGLFLVGVLCLLFFLRKLPAYALTLGALGILPLLIYGLISLHHGWFVVPNPVLLKGPLSTTLSPGLVLSRLVGFIAGLRFAAAPHLLALCIAALILYLLRLRSSSAVLEGGRALTAIFIPAAILHVEFAGIGWLFRYEAYLVALGLLATAVMSAHHVRRAIQRRNLSISVVPRYLAILLLVHALFLPLTKRAIDAVETLPKEGPWYYRITYQMGLFLKEFYPGTPVAANDIGAISYFADVYLVDLAGLGSLDVAEAIQRQEYTREAIYDLTTAKGVRIAVLSAAFPESHSHLIPREWHTVGVWKITSDIRRHRGRAMEVWFYAAPGAEESLRASLEYFASRLPSRVESVVFTTPPTL